MHLLPRSLLPSALLALLALAGCGSPAVTADDMQCALPGCVECVVDKDCARLDRPRCEGTTGTCVQCLGDAECPDGQSCRLATHQCVPACSKARGCADAGVCEGDAGLCVECLVDGDCKDAARPRCDPASQACVPCLPTGDNCAHASYCSVLAGVYSCQPGCKDDGDCAAAPDAGEVPDGGVVAGRCDTRRHQCGQCLADADCPAGKICKAGVCGDGCSDQHACPLGQTCCGATCADLVHDTAHCGGCGTACAPGFNCCGGQCSDPRGDIANCQACGSVCSVSNGTPACGPGGCGVGFCKLGWADCNATYADGCETNTDTNLASCGGCNFACSLPHALPKCAGGQCQIGACVPPFVHCTGRTSDGCEVDASTSAGNCGGCGKACSASNVPVPLCAAGNCVGACAVGWSDCNGNKLADGCETHSDVDPANCGGCGVACSQANGVASCNGGKCAIACKAGFASCSGDVRTGCETPTNTLTNCGGCGVLCKLAHAIADCGTGACKVGVCEAGWANCDGVDGNGCEVSTASDAANCGVCARACSKVNGAPACNGGVCGIVCAAGFADCDANPGNGCEVSVGTDAGNCGVCGSACSNNHVPAPSCAAGACTGACLAGWADCNGNKRFDGCEVNTQTDAANCGACGTLCALAHSIGKCAAGACAIGSCEADWADCDGNAANGCEVHIGVDVAHCGSCGRTCPAQNGAAFCAGGACGIACNLGFAHCTQNPNDGCETNLQTSTSSCGACGAACNLAHATPVCSGGACAISACQAGWADCNGLAADGCEANITSDTSSCGGCGRACSTNHAIAACVAGACQVTCIGGFGDCNGTASDGCEVTLTTDPVNCGACGAACSGNHVPAPGCAGGVCNGVCAAGFADCNGNKAVDGCEVDTLGDAGNCGGCGVRCSPNHVPVPACSGGACSGACAAGWADCDGNLQATGCETSVAANLNNCGGCGLACSQNHVTASCVASACTGACAAGFADCNGNLQADGCEAATATDASNCGACGVVCSGAHVVGSACSGGACTGNCAMGFANCDGNLQQNGCEVDTTRDANHCGGCATACPQNQTCVASTCQ